MYQFITYSFQYSLKIINIYSIPPTHANDYNVWGVSVAEAELDILTGQHKIRRVDILQDTGVRLENLFVTS